MTHHRCCDPHRSRPTLKRWQWSGEREAELARLMPLWPKDLADTSPAGRRRIVALLARGLRAERQRGRAGHWAYDLARHAALYRALTIERAALGPGPSPRR